MADSYSCSIGGVDAHVFVAQIGGPDGSGSFPLMQMDLHPKRRAAQNTGRLFFSGRHPYAPLHHRNPIEGNVDPLGPDRNARISDGGHDAAEIRVGAEKCGFHSLELATVKAT